MSALLSLLAAFVLLTAGCSSKSSQGDKTAGEATPTPRPSRSRGDAPISRVRNYPTPTRSPLQPAATRPTSRSSEPTVEEIAAIIAKMDAATTQIAQMRDRFGIQVTGITLRDKAVDVAFVVWIPERTAMILRPSAKRALIHQASGVTIQQFAKSRTGNPLRMAPGGTSANRRFITSFDNSKGLVKSGDKVTVIMDDFRVADLTVN